MCAWSPRVMREAADDTLSQPHDNKSMFRKLTAPFLIVEYEVLGMFCGGSQGGNGVR